MYLLIKVNLLERKLESKNQKVVDFLGRHTDMDQSLIKQCMSLIFAQFEQNLEVIIIARYSEF